MPKRTDIDSILIIGAGPIIIGQACEFDYSGAQACKALKEEGYRVVLVNSNPATIMTDPETADAIYIEELRAAGWYEKTSQAFAVFLPVKSVGVVGDGRRYEWVIALRAVETSDFMTARWAHLPYELLEKVSNRIINELEGVSRVTYDVSSKPPATIEWE